MEGHPHRSLTAALPLGDLSRVGHPTRHKFVQPVRAFAMPSTRRALVSARMGRASPVAPSGSMRTRLRRLGSGVHGATMGCGGTSASISAAGTRGTDPASSLRPCVKNTGRVVTISSPTLLGCGRRRLRVPRYHKMRPVSKDPVIRCMPAFWAFEASACWTASNRARRRIRVLARMVPALVDHLSDIHPVPPEDTPAVLW